MDGETGAMASRRLTPEHKKKMAEGRRAAALRREQQEQEQAAAAEQEDETAEQTLVKTNSREIRRVKSLSDVAEKYAEKSDVPSAEEIATQTEVFTRDGEEYTANDIIPHDEVKASRRDAPTVGPIEFMRDEGDDELVTFDDLMNEYGTSIELGQSYIYVNRRSPPSFQGIRIKGVQRPIRRRLTLKDFQDEYGSGEYDLIVYGPSKRGGHRYDPFTGAMKFRKLTKPITIQIPEGIPPNLDAVVSDEEVEMNNMQGRGPVIPFARGVRSTSADAKIHETTVSFEERQMLREEAKEKERREEEEKRAREQAQKEQTMLREVQRGWERQMEQLKGMYELQVAQMEERLREMREELNKQKSDPKSDSTERAITALGSLLPVMKNDNQISSDQIRQIEKAAADDRTRLIEGHRQEMQRLNESHRSEIDRMRESVEGDRKRAEQYSEDARRRADERVSETQRLANERIAEAERRFETQSREIRDESERRVRDQQTHFENRIKDIDRAHSQELRQLKESYDTRIETVRGTQQSEVSMLQNEISRLKDELSTAKAEASKGLPERISEFGEIAEGLGWSKGDGSEGPKDWKEMIADAGSNLMVKLPEIIQAVNSTLRNRQAAALPPQPAPRQLPPQPNPAEQYDNRPLAFATEDGPEMYFPSHDPAPPVYPGQHSEGPSRRPVPISQQPAQQPESTYDPHQSAPPVQHAPVQQPAQQQQPPQPAPQQQPPPQHRPAHAQHANGAPAIPPEQILQFAPLFQSSFEQGADPEDFVTEVISQLGAEQVGQILMALSPDQIASTLSTHDPKNPLLRRDGQRFLRDVWSIAGGRLSGGT